MSCGSKQPGISLGDLAADRLVSLMAADRLKLGRLDKLRVARHRSLLRALRRKARPRPTLGMLRRQVALIR